MDYYQFIYKLPKIEPIELSNTNILVQSPTINLPQLNLGFNHLLNDKREVINELFKEDVKDTFYYIVNKFEINIPDYSDTLNNRAKKYLLLNKDEIKFTPDFFIIWDILFMFNLIDDSALSYLNIDNNENSMMYGLIYYKEKFLNDKFENISYYSNVTETNSIVNKYKINKIKKNNKFKYDI